MNKPRNTPAPTPEVAARIEELLREQLAEQGEAVSRLEAHDIARNMFCEMHADGSMTYIWKNQPILRVVPEARADKPDRVLWRMFTQEEQ